MNIVEFMSKTTNLNVETKVSFGMNGALVTVVPRNEPSKVYYVSWMFYTGRGDYDAGAEHLESFLDSLYKEGVERGYFRLEDNE